MGNGSSCPFIPFRRLDVDEEVRYMLCPGRNKRALIGDVERLTRSRLAVQQEIEGIKDMPGETVRVDAKLWVDEVEKLEQESSEILKKFGSQESCLRSLCCYYYSANYNMAKNIGDMREKAKNLTEEYEKWGKLKTTVNPYDPKGENVKLEMAMKDLMDVRGDLESRVNRRIHEEPGMVQTDAVTTWLKRVQVLHEDKIKFDLEVEKNVVVMESLVARARLLCLQRANFKNQEVRMTPSASSEQETMETELQRLQDVYRDVLGSITGQMWVTPHESKQVSNVAKTWLHKATTLFQVVDGFKKQPSSSNQSGMISDKGRGQVPDVRLEIKKLLDEDKEIRTNLLLKAPIPPRNIKDWMEGGDGGNYWNDGFRTKVEHVRITIRHGHLASIEATYRIIDDLISSGPTHGRIGSQNEMIDFSGVRLLRISGFVHPWGRNNNYTKIVKAITFHTNQGTHGPYGEAIGEQFMIPPSPYVGEIVGFYGRSGECVDCIGAYVKLD